MNARNRMVIAAGLALLFTSAGHSQDYRSADQGQRPSGGSTTILPEKFLRGFDPVTLYFSSDRGPRKGPADDGAKFLRIEPAWPGAWTWLDKKTLQFRPAEPWPALKRFSVKGGGESQILTTMMSAPSNMTPAADSADLRPFRTFTLTFAQALPLESLRRMISLQVRDLPGLDTSNRRILEEFTIAELPRRSHRDAALYAVTLPEEVPEGKQLMVLISLALGDEGKVLWTGRLSTRPPFRLESVGCGAAVMPLSGDVAMPEEAAMACGHHGETPQFTFSAQLHSLTLTALKKLVHLDPAVEDLSFESYGRRVVLRGKFVPEVLYRMDLKPAAITDMDGRKLIDPGQAEVFFYLGRKQPFLRWKQASAILEAKGPRMVPLVGYGEPRTDVRIYRIDPLHAGLWPFPHSPVVVNEESNPPFPGEEPDRKDEDSDYVSPGELQRHLRLLGSPLVSKVVDLPLARRGSVTHFGLDIGKLIDKRLGRNRPGHYLVGLRRLTGPPERSYVRVQVTNLSLTSVEERDRVVFWVRSIDSAEPVSGAKIVIEALDKPPRPKPGKKRREPKRVKVELTTDSQGRAVLGRQENWSRLHRMSVRKGEDFLVLDPRDPPPRFANNHWSPWGQWLHWITEERIPDPANDKLIGFVFSERPIYRPGEKVYLKGYVRERKGGKLVRPSGKRQWEMKLTGPGGKQWTLPLTFTPLMGFSAEFMEKDVPTGTFTAVLNQKKPHQEVARRSFRIEAYRIPTFEVQLAAKEKVRNDGPFKVKAMARYYAGGSVASQPIEWQVTRRPYYHMPKGQPGFLFASSTQFSRQGRTRPPETIREESVLSTGGAHEITVNPALDMDGSARIYRLEATVTGVDNQQVSALAEVKALPPFVLGLKLQRYYEKAVTLRPEVIAVGIDDKPVAGQKVTVRLYRRTWHSHLRETDFATGKASYVTEQQDTKILEKEIQTGKKAVTPALAVEKAGVYVVELTARDKLGRVQTLSADLYMGGKEALAWKKSRQGVFELTTDAKKYRPGQTAKLIIKSPFQTGKALVIVEEPRGNSYAWRPIHGGKAVHPVSIRPEHVPNLPVHVVIMRGRLGQSADGDERYRPRTLASSLDLEVEPIKNQVKVGIGHQKTVRPGSTVDVTITLQDDRKRPVSGEVTLWLVDEAVLALADEGPLDPLDAFVVRNRRTTSLRDTRNKVIGRLQEEEEPAGDGSDEDKEGRLSGKRRVRKNFQTVPYYQATLKVGRSGKVKVRVKMSDDLTNFQMRAVAVSGMDRFGFKGSRIRVRLPVLVQPQLPRFIRQGDSFFAGGIGRLLEGPEGAGAVAVRVKGLLEEKSWTRKITLAKNKAESHLFPVTARSSDPTRPTQVTLRMDIERTKDKMGDAFEVKLPLLPDRTVEHLAYYDTLKPGTVKLKPFPEQPRAGTAVQEIVLSAVPGALELLSALDYLESYPHGCLEQKMSRLMPQMTVGTLLRKLGLNEHYATQVGDHVKRLLGEISVCQDDEGFLAYWPGGTGDVALTAQAVRFMHLARGLGLDVPNKVWTEAVAALKSSLRSDSPRLRRSYRYNQQTAAIYALTLVGELDEHYMIDLYHHRKDMDVTSMADLALAMGRHPGLFRTNLSTLKQNLWDRVVFKLYKGKPVYEGIRWYRTNWYSDYLGSRPSTLAAVMESLVYLDPENPKLSLLRDALLAFATADRGFGSTHNSLRAATALVAYLALAKHEEIEAKVKLSGGPVLELGDEKKVARVVMRDHRQQTAVVESNKDLGVHVKYSYLPAAPGDQVDSLHEGFVVSRSNTVIAEDGSPPTHFDDKMGKQVRLKVGDIVEVKAQLLVDKQRYHVALVVPFAAGLEPLNPELKTSGPEARPSQNDTLRADYVQRLDHEVRYYFIRLPKGTHNFYFRVRATNEGSFVHPAAWAEQMYHQEVRGRGVGMRVIVTGDHQK